MDDPQCKPQTVDLGDMAGLKRGLDDCALNVSMTTRHHDADHQLASCHMCKQVFYESVRVRQQWCYRPCWTLGIRKTT